jgi:structural maintenance of chromosome 4
MELETLNKQLRDLTGFVTELRGQVEKAQAAAENSREDLETLKAELDEKDQQIETFRQKEVCKSLHVDVCFVDTIWP